MEKEKIKKFTFQRRVYLLMDMDYQFSIEFNDDGTCKVESMCYARYDNEILNQTTAKKIYKRLEKIEIEKWKRNYEPDALIMDGEEWSIKLIYENGKRKYRSGINAYPENFKELEKFITYVQKGMIAEMIKK